ncbi:MAG TPA: TlpA disulfide reductase family protein, partial [Caulobacteraceae bacterium]
FRRASLSKLVIPPRPGPAPDVPFLDASGRPVRLADFKGQVVVMNMWATWCPPCKEEMPTLAKLQAVYAAQPVAVVAVSVDRDRDLAEAKAELAANPPLKLYRDPGYKLAFGLEPRAQGFPTTVIYDRQGRERARLSGAANWASPEARGMIERLLAER